MADKPILFSGPMVRALLAGTKTQTRRIIKPRPWNADGDCVDINAAKSATYGLGADGRHYFQFEHPLGGPLTAYVTRIDVGDRLYVREHWRTRARWDDVAPRDMPSDTPVECVATATGDSYGRFRQGMHMPRWASRLTLSVTDVRVERLQDISEQDAWAEGCTKGDPDDVGGFFPAEEPDPSGIGYRGWDNARDWYADLWDHINGDGAWDANPWVAAYTFTVELGNIDQIGGAR